MLKGIKLWLILLINYAYFSATYFICVIYYLSAHAFCEICDELLEDRSDSRSPLLFIVFNSCLLSVYLYELKEEHLLHTHSYKVRIKSIRQLLNITSYFLPVSPVDIKIVEFFRRT